MKKIVWTLLVDGYFPELAAITVPNHEAYAKKIGAEFRCIETRNYPEWHPTYEKVQIYQLGQDSDWNIHIDADLMVGPSMLDVTEVPPHHISYYSIYDPALYFAPDVYFARDGRRIGICSAFIAVPSSCHDLWEPFDVPYEVALQGINKPHGIDDYCFSRNFAKYGLKGCFFPYPDERIDDHIIHLGVGGEANPETRDSILKRAREFAASKS